ncbi:DUF427 domain-containing protein [Novosphingobium aquimarinum]|uniref:DUF427 domain-containing protein n=1 Tax=Novosphingobium aquimarinum TaxID=2682494 RepID=UPI0012EB7779|nr:DUF427 domain-containing protein [Novosphingobium aquimarinum]
MNDRPVRHPDEKHPIAITECPSTVLVNAGPLDIAKTHAALTLTEANYGPVQYVPAADVDMSLLERSDHTTYCPYKGEASYYSIPALGEGGVNAVWTYEAPFEAVSAIAGHLAFYPDRVSVQLKS